MEYRVLGPLEVLDARGQKLKLGGAMQQSVLASLLLRAGLTVSLDHLIDELWETPPESAMKTVRAYVSRLRHELPSGTIEGRPGGYAFVSDGAELDLATFERQSEEGRSALAAGDYEQAANLLRQALAVWRGPALAGLTSDPLRREAERLEEARLGALEDRIEADLGSARGAEVVPELTALVAEHPFRERLRAQLMRALYRAGRPGDALTLYRETRRLLVEELGMEPGQELRELEQAILRQDVEIDEPTHRRPPSAAQGPALEPAVAEAPEREVRKTVTVLFCDVVDSTGQGETSDPELVRALLARYFERMKAIVEHHGGTVEKFIGDAVMAVFGIPVAHEDDAARACRAAFEMRQSFAELEVEGRIGMTTGEVVTGTQERLATGDAVNVAARLQQAASPGEILLGKPTRELAQEVVDVEALTPLKLKGKRQAVEAYRLCAVGESPARSHTTPFVGREQEVALIVGAWEQVLHEQRCELLTVVGEAGVGKSRLVAEAMARLDGHVVQGRCLPYGKGITYWPVVEVAKQLDFLPDDPAAEKAINSLLSSTSDGASADIAWAFRKLLEKAAPRIVVFDDLQWAEETFLELIEYLTLVSSGFPLLIVAMARPELAERRSTWPIAVHLQPLPNARIHELIGAGVPVELKQRIARAAGGNPLFVSEMLAMATQAEGEVTVPPSLRALLAARLDQLSPDEREVLESGAIEGEVFHRGAVQALAGDEIRVTPSLVLLARKGLIRSERAQLVGDDAFRFCHLLIRDAAYEAQPKSTRAELHQRFATWLEQPGRGLVEADEIAGYHLEQASHYQSEVGRPRDDLAAAARQRLTAAGRRTLSRQDFPAAGNLFMRALALVPAGELDVPLESNLCTALAWRGELREAFLRASSVGERSAAAGDRIGELCGRLHAGTLRPQIGEGGVSELAALAEEALPILEAAGDDFALQLAYHARGQAATWQGKMAVQVEAYEQAVRYARRAGLPTEPLLLWAEDGLFNGTTPASELLAWQDAQEERVRRLPRFRGHRAAALAMLGRLDEASVMLAEVRAEIAERPFALVVLVMNLFTVADVSLLAGDPATAIEAGLEGYRRYEAAGFIGRQVIWAGYLATTYCQLGRFDDAERWANRSAALSPTGESSGLFGMRDWRLAKAQVLAARGDFEQAQALAREAVLLIEATDLLNQQGNAYEILATVSEIAGQMDEAATALNHALERYERKENLVMAERVRTRMAGLERSGASRARNST